MIKTYFISLLLTIWAFGANAQSFDRLPDPSKELPQKEVKVSSTADEKKAVPTKTEYSAPEQIDYTAEMAARGIKTLPPEEVDKMRDDLRNDLLKTTKFDDEKERINYLEVNNRIDKTLYRRKLENMGEDYKTSDKIAQRKEKIRINPNNDSQMEKLILERAGVPEDNNNQK